MMRLQVCFAALTILNLVAVPAALNVQLQNRHATSGDRKRARVAHDEPAPTARNRSDTRGGLIADDLAYKNCFRPRLGDPPADGEEIDAAAFEDAVPWQAGQTSRMRDMRSSSWARLEPIPYVQRRPKLAVMMFVTDRAYNPQVWLDWIKQAELDGLPFKFMIHRTVFSHNWDAGWRLGLSQYEVPCEQQHTCAPKWCNMWNGTMFLIQRALEDPDVSHLYLASHNSIPVKPLRHIYQELNIDPSTRMCADNTWRGKDSTPRAETWWLMRREDAQLFHANRELAYTFSASTSATHDCADEQSWYYPLRLRSDVWGSPLRDECVMFTDWQDGSGRCKNWHTIVERCGKACDELRSETHRENRSDSGHPVAFKNVTASAIQGLVESPFWFARKFNDGEIKIDAVRFLRQAGAQLP